VTQLSLDYFEKYDIISGSFNNIDFFDFYGQFNGIHSHLVPFVNIREVNQAN